MSRPQTAPKAHPAAHPSCDPATGDVTVPAGLAAPTGLAGGLVTDPATGLGTRPVVIKFGGHALDSSDALARFAAGVVALVRAGLSPVVTHGGGPQIDAMLARLGVPSAGRHQGLRVTTPQVMEVVRLVLRGQVGPAIAAAITEAANAEVNTASCGPVPHGEPVPLDGAAPSGAVALSGEDGRLLTAMPRDPALGLVGEIVKARPGVLEALLAAGQVPVVAPIAPDATGAPHNVNADAVAAALAIALRAERLVMLTDVPGLCRRWPDPRSLISRIDADELEALLPTLEAGMIPKMSACLRAVRSGVPSAHVLDGRDGSWPAALISAAPSAGTTVLRATSSLVTSNAVTWGAGS